MVDIACENTRMRSRIQKNWNIADTAAPKIA